MKHNDKRKLGIIATLSTFAVFGLTATLVLTGGNINPFNVAGEDNSDYFVTLDSSNKYTSGTTKDVTTSSGAWQITFEYSGASSYANGHVTLSQNGSLQNKTLIKSVDYIQVDWNSTGSGKLQAKTSFNGSTWGELWDVTDDFSYHLPSNPYFISFVATGGSVNISSVRYQYSCIDNPEAEGKLTGYKYQLVKSKSEIASGDIVYIVGKNYYKSVEYGPVCLDTSIPNPSNPWYPGGTSVTVLNDTIDGGGTDWTVTTSADKYIFTSGGNDLYGYYNGTNYSINIGTTYTRSGQTTNVVTSYNAQNTWEWTIANSTTGISHLECTNNSSEGKRTSLVATPSYNPATWSGKSSSQWSSVDDFPVYIYKKIAVREWDKPKDVVGFTATDSKSSSYKTTSIYSSENGLSVTAHYSDGTSANVLPSEYTYKVSTDRAGQNVIDKTKPFGTSGIYYVTVNYANLMPSIIELNVGASITGVTAAMSNSTYTTADTVVYANNLTATLQFDNGSSVTKTYAEFASAGLTVKLMTPAGVEYNPSLPFGTAGNWKVRVSYSSTIYADVSVTVNAIPVQSISFSEGSTSTLYVGNTMQLNVVFNPTTATNKNVSWGTSDSTVASVDEGLITAKKVGSAVITATAESDSSKKATMTVTVKKQTTTTATLIPNNGGANDSTAISNSTDRFDTTGMEITYFTSEKVFGYSTTNVFKFGGSSAAGSITIEFAATVISGVKVTAATFGSDSGVGVKVSTSANQTGETISLTSTSSKEYVTTAFSSDSVESTSFTIEQTKASKGRFYLYGIELTIGGGEPIYPTAISLPGTKDIYLGNAYDLNNDLTFTPSDTTQKTVTWSSNNTSVATVSDGIVTPVKAGNATITATAKDENDNDLTASCVVTVKTVAVTGVSLNQTTAELSVGSTKTLTATVSPSNATNKNVTWTSSNTSVATVSEGTITAKAVGSATITVTTVDGNKTATCSVTVTAAAPGYVHIDSSDLTATAIDYNPIYAPTEGDIKVLIVPLSLNGSTKGTWNTTTLNNMNTYFFGSGATSFKSYYNSVSHGKARFTGLVADPYTVTEYTTEELNNDSSMESIFTLMENAVKKIMNDNSSLDWSQYDQNNDGWFDNIHFLTNYNATDWGANLWPHQYNTGHSAGTHSRPKVNNYSISSLYVQDELMSDALTQVHEQGHIFGMDDYYNYSDDYADYIGSADMQDCNMFEWNSFSKLSAGWASPYVVDGTSNDFTLTMNSAATSEDCLIIPANYSTWNGSAFDEYFVVELFTNSGLNSSFWNSYVSGYKSYGASLPSSGYGVRIYHVDGRVCRNGYTTEVDPSDWNTSKYSYIQGCNNSTDASDYGSHNTSWKNYTLLNLVQASGTNTHSAGDYMCSSDLFQTGDTFNWSLGSKFLLKSGSAASKMNNGETFPWTISFTAMSKTSVTMRITRN